MPAFRVAASVRIDPRFSRDSGHDDLFSRVDVFPVLGAAGIVVITRSRPLPQPRPSPRPSSPDRSPDGHRGDRGDAPRPGGGIGGRCWAASSSARKTYEPAG
jgi:hypothetical protein